MSIRPQQEPARAGQFNKLFFRPDEAAKATGLCRNVIFDAIAANKLSSVKVGRARLIAREDLIGFVNSHREAA